MFAKSIHGLQTGQNFYLSPRCTEGSYNLLVVALSYLHSHTILTNNVSVDDKNWLGCLAGTIIIDKNFTTANLTEKNRVL